MVATFCTTRKYIKPVDEIAGRISRAVVVGRSVVEAYRKLGAGHADLARMLQSHCIPGKVNFAMLEDACNLGTQAVSKLDEWVHEARRGNGGKQQSTLTVGLALAREMEDQLQAATNAMWAAGPITELQGVLLSLQEDLRRTAALAQGPVAGAA